MSASRVEFHGLVFPNFSHVLNEILQVCSDLRHVVCGLSCSTTSAQLLCIDELGDVSVLTRTVGIRDLSCSDEQVPEVMDIVLEEGSRFVGLGIAVVDVEDEFPD